MTDIKQQRRDNLLRCKRERFDDVAGSLARAINRSSSQVHQWIAGSRSISEDSARHIEISLGLPEGWMDQAPDPGNAHHDDAQTIHVGHLALTTRNLLRDLADALGDRQLPDRDLALLQAIVSHMHADSGASDRSSPAPEGRPDTAA